MQFRRRAAAAAAWPLLWATFCAHAAGGGQRGCRQKIVSYPSVYTRGDIGAKFVRQFCRRTILMNVRFFVFL